MEKENENLLIIESTKKWLEKAVIGLNLCPFAKSVYKNDLIRFVVSKAATEQTLIRVLEAELKLLEMAAPIEIETTLIILPNCFANFLDFNDFLGVADDCLIKFELEGIFQIASFHPNYQFAGKRADDILNYVNRSPYPILHLLRETSVELAVDGFPDINSIVQNNIKTLRKLGLEGWNKL